MLPSNNLSKKRASKLLSGAEVINAKNSSLKDLPSAFKEYAPNNSWLEQKQIQGTLETYHNLLASERIEKRSTLSTAVWLVDAGKAKVTKKTGKVWEVFGHTVNSEDYLLPEEALFLLETNSLELYLDDVPLSVEQTYAKVIGDYCSLQEYRVYSHLSRRGYRVLRHDKEITLTQYERKIHLDQITLAQKRGTKEKIDEENQNGGEADETVAANVSSSSTDAAIEEITVTSNIKDTLLDSAPPNQEEEMNEETGKNCEEVAGSSEIKGDSVTSIAEDEITLTSNKTNTFLDQTSPNQEEEKNEETDKNCEEVAGSSPIKGDAVISMAEEAIALDTNETSTNLEVTSVVQEESTEEIELEERQKSPEEAEECTQVEGENEEMRDAGGDMVTKEAADNGSKKEESNEACSKSSVSILNEDDVDSLIEIVSVESKRDHTPTKVHQVELQTEVPPLQRVSSSPDIVEMTDEDIIEIKDDGQESDDDVVILMEVDRALNTATVDLLESDDDDVVFICKKAGNNDPSKRRQWFLTVPTFVNTVFSETDDSSQKTTKIKLIDYFDLANKSVDAIMKAIPRHDGPEDFMNAPDQRFIPTNILPRFAQYRVNVQTENEGNYNSEGLRQLAHANSDTQSNSDPRVDTSHSLSQIVRYGQPSPSFTRKSYGYSFHRTRHFNNRTSYDNSGYRRYSRGYSNNDNYNRNNFFHNRFNPDTQNSARFNSSDEAPDEQRSNEFTSGDSPYSNNFNHSRGPDNHDNSGNSYQYSANNFSGPRRNPSFQNYNNTRNNFQNRSFGNFQNNNFQDRAPPIKLALQQAYQMQFLAMNLIQSSQNLMRGCGGQLNFFNPTNNFNLMDLFNTSNMNPAGSQFNNRGRRPYRRPYSRRPFGGRRRYFSNDQERSSPKVVELLSVDSDDEDRKVKPTIKRTAALCAIADLNSPKRPKVSEAMDEDEKKLFTVEEPTKVSNRTASVKLEKDKIKIEEIITVDSDANSSDSDVCEVVPIVESSSPLSVVEMVVDDEESSVNYEEASITTEVDLEVVDAVKNLEEHSGKVTTDTIVEKDLSNDQAPSDDPKSAQDGSSETILNTSTSEGETPNSWETYKKDLPELDLTHSKNFRSMLSYDDQRASVQEVLASLQVIGPIDDTDPLRNEIKVTYDVYLPNQPFRKSLKMLPNYRVIVGSSTCPTIFEMNYLKDTYKDDVPFLFAVVYEDSIGLYNFNPISLPTLNIDV